jgi:hypothetical protein
MPKAVGRPMHGSWMILDQDEEGLGSIASESQVLDVRGVGDSPLPATVTSSRACNVQHYEKVWRKAVEMMADGDGVYAAKQ